MFKRPPSTPFFLVGPAFFIGLTVFLAAFLVSHLERPVQIGMIAGLSGRAADYGTGGRNGATLVVEQRNRAGGIDGRPVRLIVGDDQKNPEVARRGFRILADRHVGAIIGPMTSAMATAIVPLAEKHRTVLISPTGATDFLSGLDDNFFRIISPNQVYLQQMARHMRNVLALAWVAILYDLENAAYSESWLESSRREFQGLGGEVVYTEGYKSGPDVRFFDLTIKSPEFKA